MSDFSSGHDLKVYGFEPHTGLFADSAEPALDSLSSFLSLKNIENKTKQNKIVRFLLSFTVGHLLPLMTAVQCFIVYKHSQNYPALH